MSADDELCGSDWTADLDATVVEVRIETLAVGSGGSKRAFAWWSDGSTGEALRWYDDEILFTEGDFLGRTRTELRALKFRRDRDWLTT